MASEIEEVCLQELTWRCDGAPLPPSTPLTRREKRALWRLGLFLYRHGRACSGPYTRWQTDSFYSDLVFWWPSSTILSGYNPSVTCYVGPYDGWRGGYVGSRIDVDKAGPWCALIRRILKDPLWKFEDSIKKEAGSNA